MISFIEPDRAGITKYERQIYDILSKNMLELLPNESYIEAEEYFPIWKNSLHDRLDKNECVLIVCICDDTVAGYLQYSICENTIIIEELHISPKYRIKYNILGELLKYLSARIKSNVRFIQARVNKNNENMNNILRKLGFTANRESGNGKGYIYIGDWLILAKNK